MGKKAAKLMDMARVLPQSGVCRWEAARMAVDGTLMFFLFSFFGWLYEIGLTFLQTGLMVNRGAFHGPWLPIYGVSGVLMAGGFRALRNRPLHLFSLCLILSAIIEYSSSVLLETLFGLRWWDYSHLPFNLGGRICLPVLLFFASAGFLLTRYIAPLVQNGLDRVSPRTKGLCCLMLCALFFVDILLTLADPNAGVGIAV